MRKKEECEVEREYIILCDVRVADGGNFWYLPSLPSNEHKLVMNIRTKPSQRYCNTTIKCLKATKSSQIEELCTNY